MNDYVLKPLSLFWIHYIQFVEHNCVSDSFVYTNDAWEHTVAMIIRKYDFRCKIHDSVVRQKYKNGVKLN